MSRLFENWAYKNNQKYVTGYKLHLKKTEVEKYKFDKSDLDITYTDDFILVKKLKNKGDV